VLPAPSSGSVCKTGVTTLTPTVQPGSTRWRCWALLLLVAAAPSRATDAGRGPLPPSASPASEPITALWRALTADLGSTLTASQRLLLGDRDPNGPSCVRPMGSKALAFASNGGPGTRLAYIWYDSASARLSPAADFAWQQTTLRPVLEDIAKRNSEILPRAVRLAETAGRLAAAVRSGPLVPGALTTSPAAKHTWPGYCAENLVSAARAGDLAAARRWADELASATWALADLHRWLGFLVSNYLTTLDFQARCKSLYDSCDVTYSGKFAMDPLLSCLPGGQAAGSAIRNCTEVERQAEWLFRVPREYVARGLDGTVAPKREEGEQVAAAVRMPPRLRSAFVRLRAHLSPPVRKVWDQAAQSPFHRSYLASMLHRAVAAQTLDALGVVLKRYEQANPDPTPHGLMDVIFSRGGGPESGYDWAERFDPRLMAAAATFGGSDAQVLLRAQHFARALLGTAAHYGASDSVREALDRNRFDCINGTGIIGSLYRNAGRSGFYTIRWSGGRVGHTVAAAEVAEPDGRAIVIVDALEDAQTATERWPSAYDRGHRWPPTYVGLRADLYAAELYTRGLETYVWAEGYIVRGPHAGVLVRASVPYLPNRMLPGTQRVEQPTVADQALPNSG